MTHKDFKETYSHEWAKAAQNVKTVIEQIQEWFPYQKWAAGHGALSDELISGEHDAGEPDIILLFDGEPILGIEVTGSDRVTWPWTSEVWIGAHKVQFAKTCNYPVVYVLFYKGTDGIRVISQTVLESITKEPEIRRVYCDYERYYIVPPTATLSFGELEHYIEGARRFAEAEYHAREDRLAGLFDRLGGDSWEW